MKTSVRLTDKEVVDIIKGYSVELIPMIALAAKYGISRQGVFKVLRKAGIDTTKAGAAWLTVSCSCCGKEIKRRRAQVRKTKHLFCEDACYYAWLKTGNGNPFIEHRQSGRQARKIVSKYYPLREGQIVHHEDRNQWNNAPYNLRVFANSGDHIRHHRGFIVPIIWDGSTIP